MIEEKSEKDLEYARDTYIELIEKAKQAIEFSFSLAQDSESPRATEVFANLIKSASDITDRLTELHMTKTATKAVAKTDTADPLGIPLQANQFNFFGTTTSIQEMLKEIALDEKKIINNIEHKSK